MCGPRIPLAIGGLLAVVVDLAPAQLRLEDPAPPIVHALPPVEAPAAQAYAELRTFAAVRALADDARVEDWPGFRGARRDGRELSRYVC